MTVVENSIPNGFKLCECNRESCNEIIPEKDKQGIPRRFKQGHNNTGENHYNYKGITKDSNGYILILSPNHPFRDSHNYVPEHRLVMEKHLGRYLTKLEEVHHIDFNKQNNKIENLMLFSSHSEHVKFERTGIYKIDYSNYFCLLCGSKDTYIMKNNDRPHWYGYEGGFICNKCHCKKYYYKNRKS